MWKGRPTWAEIDLDALAHNVGEIRKAVGQDTGVMAVVKANAYGHGAVPISRAVIAAGASRLGVACVDEGIELRQAGIKAPILVMGYVPIWEAGALVQYGLVPTITSRELGKALSELASRSKFILPVHVKVDTGLSRFGLSPADTIAMVAYLRNLPGVTIEGLWTHFASADEADKSFTLRQFAAFSALANLCPDIPCRHVGASAVALDLPAMGLNLVRAGISLYGLYPSSEVSHAIYLKPVLSLKSRIGRLTSLSIGDAVSYGRTWVATGPTRVALVPCGYADGLRRSLSNKGAVLIAGHRAPILGRVCMDQFVADVTGIPNVKVDDEVVLIGRQGAEEISVEEMASWSDTINYEIVCGISARVPRIYLRNGQIDEAVTLVKKTG
ncbi:MAG: alanine racemase [Dehalococcoidia bacterium]|nr:alanine racemase [Dehalococcoidia bacterium]